MGRPGQWVFPAAVDGRQEFEPGSAILSVRFSARWLDRRSLFDHSRPLLLEAKDCPYLEEAGTALVRAINTHVGRVKRELWSTPTAIDTHFIVQQHFQAWLTAYVRAMHSAGLEPYLMDETDARLLEAMQFIEAFPLSRTLHEPDVARAAGLSVSHLNRLFASEYGTTPKRYFDVRRQEFASNALLFTPMQVKSIAYKLGFSSLPHFTKWFHRRTGHTPTAYRRAGQAGE
jgi:AraC-like DNA-binding protein